MSRLTNKVRYDEIEDDIAELQRAVSVLLYISLIAHGLDVYLTNVGVLEGLIPAMQIIAAVAAIVFFVAECLLLPTVGVLIVTGMAALLSFIMPYLIAFLVRSFIESMLFMVIGGVVMALSVGVIIYVANGVIIGAVVAPLMITPFLAGAGTVGVTALAGAGIAAGVDAGVRQVRPVDLVRPRRVIANVALLLVLVWPVLTWAGLFQGVFALKPVQRAQQQYLSFSQENTSLAYERFFVPDEEYSYSLNGVQNWTFGDGFYDSYIYPGRNSFAQGSAPSASSDTNLGFCLNGMIYLVDVEKNECYHTTAYTPGQDDAMVMVGQEVFLFSNDRIALLGPSGRYLWKDTTWTSDFDRLSEEEQYDRLYAILEEQNDGQPGTISIEDVAVVACAQRSGRLLYYDAAEHCAYFGQAGKKGTITILCQSGLGVREKRTSFTPNYEGDNMPYTMLNADVVAYIDGNQIVFQGVNEDWSNVHYTNKSHDGEQHPFVSFHVMHDEDGTEFFAYHDSEDAICLERLSSAVMEAHFNPTKYDGVYSVGTYIYGIVYDSDDLLNKFTYVQDLQEDQDATAVWTENWSWERIHIHDGLWDTEEDVEKNAEPVEKTFIEMFPSPETRTTVRQIGLYKDNVVSPSQYYYYKGPADRFYFRYPSILYEEVEYTYVEDGSEVQIHFYCVDDPSSLTVTLRPNTDGTDHQTLLSELQKVAVAEMVDVKAVRSGLYDQEGTASTFYLTGFAADDTDLICNKLCWVDNESIMEMELRMPKATTNEDRAHKDFYAKAMYAYCGFGSGKEPEAWWKFKKDYGL